MKWLALTGVIVALIGIALFAFQNTQPSQSEEAPVQEVRVILTDIGYEPKDITLALGGTITFANETQKPHWPASNLHPTHSIYPEFDPQRPLEPSEEWSFTFKYPGTFNFHDHIRSYYVGTVHVVK